MACTTLTNTVNLTCLPNSPTNASEIQILVNIVLGIVGAISVLTIVISGFRYIVANGNPESVAKAKAGIGYAIIGLLVTIFAEAIVTFVTGQL